MAVPSRHALLGVALFVGACEALAHAPLLRASRWSLPAASRAPAAPRMEAFSFDPFDREVFRILMDAQTEARVLGGASVGTEHLLLAATMQKDDVQAALDGAGLSVDPLRTQLRGGEKAGLPGLDRLFASQAKDELLPFAKDTERALKASVARSKEPGGAMSRDELITWRELMLQVLGNHGVIKG